MTTHFPQISKNTQKVAYNYKSLDQSINFKKSNALSKSQSVNRNIDRYYQTSDVHDILGHEKSSYPGFSKTEGGLQNAEVSGNLKGLRKSYDVLRGKSHQKEKEIQKMRNEIEQIKVQQNGMSGNTDFYEKKLEDLQNQQERIGNQLYEARWQKKIYENMITRMKSDLICFKKKVYVTQEELDKGKQVLISAKDKFQKAKQRYNKIEIAREEVILQKEEDGNERQRNMDSFISSVLDKQDQEKQREARIKRQIEIAEIAANDIRDSNLKKWRKLLLVHNFLNTFLKRKMEREMQKYRGVEQAFQKIKASTGISEAGEIVHKFLNREHTYSHLLISIADYEKKIDDLKKQNEAYKTKLQKLKQDIIPLEKESNKNQNFQNEEITQKLQRTSDKADQCQLVEERFFEWLLRNLMRIERAAGIEKEKKEYYGKYTKDNLGEAFEHLTQLLDEHLLKVDASEIDDVISQSIKKKKKPRTEKQLDSQQSVMNCSTPNNDNIIIEENGQQEFQKRNVRVRPPSHRLDTSFNSIKDSKDFSDTNTKEEEDEDDKDNQEENNYLNKMRQNLRYQDSARKSLANNGTNKK